MKPTRHTMKNLKKTSGVFVDDKKFAEAAMRVMQAAAARGRKKRAHDSLKPTVVKE